MKKIYVLIAVAALVLSAASCGNKKAKEAAAEPAAQEVAAEPTAAEEVKDAAKEAIAAGAEAVKDEIKK